MLKEESSLCNITIDITQFMNKCQVCQKEIVFKDVSVEEMMEIISENRDKLTLKHLMEYSNLEAAYLNLLKETGGVKF